MRIAEYTAGRIVKVEQASRSGPRHFTQSNDELRLAGLIAENNRLSSWHMELADFINLGDRDPAMRFLVIGGLAGGGGRDTPAPFCLEFFFRPGGARGGVFPVVRAG